MPIVITVGMAKIEENIMLLKFCQVSGSGECFHNGVITAGREFIVPRPRRGSREIPEQQQRKRWEAAGSYDAFLNAFSRTTHSCSS
jgi:hypothetical protein